MTTMQCYNMKLKFFTPLLLFLAAIIGFAPSALAQKNKDKSKDPAVMMKEILEYKLKYLIQEADITKEQQAEFVKLYTEMSNAKLALLKSTHDTQKTLKGKSSPTDEDYYKVSEEMAQSKKKEGEIDLKYYQQFKRLLSAKQLYKLKAAEMEFNRKMMKMREKKK